MKLTNAQSSAHLRYVDGLRAIAILMVMEYHAQKYGITAHGPLGKLWYIGMHGVDLFFVISGLCLAFPFVRSMHAKGSFEFPWVEYLAKRFVRVLPIYWTVIGLFFICSFLPGWAEYANATKISAVHIGVQELVQTSFFLDGRTSHVNGSFWTLAVELRWYFLFPGCLALWAIAPRVFYAVLAVLVLYVPHTRLDLSTDFRTLPGFMSGILVADAIFRPRAWMRYAPALAFVALLATSVLTKSDPHAYKVSIGWQISWYLFCIAVVTSSRLQSLLAFRPIAAVGIASYSIYLVHEPIIAWLETVYGVTPIAAIAAAGCVGACAWALLERPLTSPAMRIRMVAAVHSSLIRMLPWLGVRGVFRISAQPIDHETLPVVRSAALEPHGLLSTEVAAT